ncbi:mucin-5AC-like [Patiria miniata]|uniref:CTCK domain-containing protein n=1 Tax=Patiria miniata TaxID=46514 RepID=A0A913YYY9_PATMI|nr:mucin-5AC-like [Patiria miniata]
METMKDETTTTVRATTEAETTTKTTTTAKITKLATPITKETCSDVLTPFTSRRLEVDGQMPATRILRVPFTTPVTLTEVMLQGDAQGNAIESFNVRYRLYEGDKTLELQGDSGPKVFNVPWDVDVTNPVTVPLPFTELDNLIEITLYNLIVPENKAVSFIAEFHGCVKLPIITPSTTTLVTTTTSTTTAPTSTAPEMLNTMQSSTVTTTTAKATTTEVTRQTVKKVTEPEKLCDKDLSKFDEITVTRSTDLGSMSASEPWRPSNGNPKLTVTFDPPVVVRSLTAEQDDDFDFMVLYLLPGSSTKYIIKDSNGKLKLFNGGADPVKQYLPEDMVEIQALELLYRSQISADPDSGPEVNLNLFGCFDHLTTTAVTTTVSKVETTPKETMKPTVEIKTTTERVSLSPTQKVIITATSIPGKETSTVKETISSAETVTESVSETKEAGVTSFKASTTVTTQNPLTTTLGICTENLETSPALIGIDIERTTSMPDNGESSFRTADVWIPSVSDDGTVPYVKLQSDYPLRLNALKMAGDGRGNGVTQFRLKYLPVGSETETYYKDSTTGVVKTFSGRLTTQSSKPVWVYLKEPTEPIESLTVEITAYQGTQPALRIDFFGCAGQPMTTTKQSTFERVTSAEKVVTTVTESINNVVTSTKQTIELLGTTTESTTTEGPQTPHVGVTVAPTEEEGGTTEMATTAETTTTEAPGCMYNGRMYQYGEELPSRDPCSRRLCELGAGILEIREECDLRCDGKLRYVEEQCCPICEKESRQCLRESKLETLRIGNCVSEEPVQFTYCNGGCPSRAFIDMLPGRAELSRDCRCCQPSTMGVRETRLNCDGVMQEYSYQVIETCSCEVCTFSLPNQPENSDNSGQPPNGR